eukprot:NODE_5759_length_489_cov_182.413636_g2494_i1.p1 GENE.NODE_5759_length_489_cov_182.413636_g2494_i1~~NODE_5759_length_489_cov_182.413636_g2494_i1.p1  ORF type:complete len:64 (+),score=0.36 NODE_5759_length_489_cov_182.413636_g2494_i1:251-442(+)
MVSLFSFCGIGYSLFFVVVSVCSSSFFFSVGIYLSFVLFFFSFFVALASPDFHQYCYYSFFLL